MAARTPPSKAMPKAASIGTWPRAITHTISATNNPPVLRMKGASLKRSNIYFFPFRARERGVET